MYIFNHLLIRKKKLKLFLGVNSDHLCVVDVIHPGKFTFGTMTKVYNNPLETVKRISFPDIVRRNGKLFDQLYQHMWSVKKYPSSLIFLMLC